MSDYDETGSNGSADNNSLITALAGDATKIGAAFIAADAAKNVSKSPNAKYLVYGGVAIAALVVVFLIVKK